MSADQLRNQVISLQKIIVKLQGDKSKKVEDAAKAGKRSSDALTAAARTSSISTATSKRRDALRYADDQAKTQVEVGKIGKKIAAENKKLIAVQRRLDDEIKRELKQRNAVQAKHVKDHKKMFVGQERAMREQNRKMRVLDDGLSKHADLHAETAREIERLKALPEKIAVVFFAADPGSSSSTKLALDEEARLIRERIRASEYRASEYKDAVEFHTRWAVRPMDVLQAINELRPTIVHFSGHGTIADTLVLQDDQGQPKHVSMEAIVSAMALGS
ncbi:hypothetical protein [Pseudomonas sp. URMO17WK12:I12]|uniref:hypothetical protein n=1 Tax=Pseudomonas sp. URMO17WK12:I12 TaxID=1259797 RepID=UPI0004B96B35|nr:hypothetical protein [Pseudomonas sp. URMO17WK12:I12]